VPIPAPVGTLPRRDPVGSDQPLDDQPLDAYDNGPHRGAGTSLSAALDAVAFMGSLVTSASLLVVTIAVGAVAVGGPPVDSAPITITSDTAE